MKTYSVQIVNNKMLSVLRRFQSLGWIKVNPGLPEPAKNAEKEPWDFDPETELANYGLSMEEIVNEVKEARAERYAKKPNEDRS